MKLYFSTTFASAALLILSCTSAHSWNEQLAVIDSSGKYAGAYGYPRGYVARTDPTFNGFSMDWLLPPLSSGRTRIDDTDMLCHTAQRTQTQSANYPRLQVSPGSYIAMKYLENGHVTLPQNQPGKQPKGGTVFVYGTTDPSATEKLTTVLQWTSDGQGGDGRGVLLAAQNFDDGRCHQINGGPISIQRQQQWPDPYPGQPTSKNELWCESNAQIPTSAPTGKLYTLYWVWQWPTAPGSPGIPDGKDEFYTTCSDVEIVSETQNGPVSNTLAQQDPMMTAVSDYQSRTALNPKADDAFLNSNGGTATTAGITMSTAAPSALTFSNPILGSSSVGFASFNSTPTTTLQTMAAPTNFGFQSIAQQFGSSVSESFAATTTVADSQPSLTILTALVTVIATMTPGQKMLILSGTHEVTFIAPDATAALASPSATIEARDLDSAAKAHVEQRSRQGRFHVRGAPR